MEKKRILIVTQYFYPENFRSSDLAFEMAKRGHDVTALVGIPNYPQGVYYKGYNLFRRRAETVNEVKIYRAFQSPRGKKGGAVGLILNYLTFAICATIDILLLCLFKKFDVILVHETSPITQGIPAIIAKKIFKVPVFFWVLDLWPESLEAVGAVKNKKVLDNVNILVKWIYDNSNKILISSRSFKKSICEKGDYEKKILYFPNWVEDDLLYGSEFDLLDFGDKFIAMFAGNIGEAQDLESIINAAEILKNEEKIRFVIVGDGRKREWTQNETNKRELRNVIFTGRYPKEVMPSMFAKADVMIVSLKDDKIFNMTVPAKLQAYMALAKPVIGMINGETADLIEDSRCGYCVGASMYKDLADKIMQMSLLPKQELMLMGKNGKSFYEKYFSKKLCMNNFEKILSYYNE